VYDTSPRLPPCKTYGHDGGQFLSEDPPEWPAPHDLFSSTGSRSLCSRPRPCSEDDLVGGDGGSALLVEPPAEAGGCSPGNARAAARVAEPDVRTMRAHSMATTAAFLIVDSEELLLLLSFLRWIFLLK